MAVRFKQKRLAFWTQKKSRFHLTISHLNLRLESSGKTWKYVRRVYGMKVGAHYPGRSAGWPDGAWRSGDAS